MKDTCVVGFLVFGGLIWALLWRDTRLSRSMPKWVRAILTIAALLFVAMLVN